MLQYGQYEPRMNDPMKKQLKPFFSMASSEFTSKVAPKNSLGKKTLYFLGTTLFSIFVLFLVSRISCVDKDKSYTHRRCSPDSHKSSTICTDGCRIPLLAMDQDSYEKLIEHEYHKLEKLKPCPKNPLLRSNKTHIWVEKGNMPYYNLSSSSQFRCCYASFYRLDAGKGMFHHSPIGHKIKYNDCRHFTDTIEVDSEFVRATCVNINTTLFDSFFVFAFERGLKTKGKDLPYNVLILGIDGVSRLNFHRTMPKTSNFLKMYGAVELLGYNKVADNTFPNLMPLLLGLTESETEKKYFFWHWKRFDSCPLIWKLFQQAGFATALAEDTYRYGTFNYIKRGFRNPPTDYYLEPFISEAENYAANNLNHYVKLCSNDKFFFQLLLDYVEDLTNLKNKLFGFFWEVTMTHHDLLFPTVMDDSYSGFFNRLYASGYLNKSIIFLISDHGLRYGAFRRSKQGFLEERLPFVFALMPPSFRVNYNEAFNNLKLNRYRLTSPFDMHATLTDLVNLENIKNDKILLRSKRSYTRKGTSLFLPISGRRTCQSAGIDDHWCTCYRNLKLKLDNDLAKEAFTYSITYLNNLFLDNPKCSYLNLNKSIEATQLLSETIKEGCVELVVAFETEPGGGVFEATLARDTNGRWSVIGSMSRLNLYGNQSYCVTDPRLKLYCYCIDTSIITGSNKTEAIPILKT